MQHMRNAVRIDSANLRMSWEIRQLDTCIQLGIEIQCGLYVAPSPVHARQMNDANMHSIRMLIENDPKLTIKSR